MRILANRFLIFGFAAILVLPLFACTGFYVGKGVSADGTTLIGRTVDLPNWTACFRLQRVPRGEGVRYAHVCTPDARAKDGRSMSSACANETGFVVSGTVTGRTSGPALAADPFVKGGYGEHDFPGVIAANCGSAAEALDFIAREIAARGHNGAEIYMFADRKEAWCLEVYTGHQWAAVRMPEDKVACFGNQFMIRSFDSSSPDVRMSPELISLAKEKGFLRTGADGLPDISATYGAPLWDYANLRTWFGHRTLAPATAGAYATSFVMPLFFEPERKVAVRDIFELMRTRYEGTEFCPEETGNRKIRTIGTTKQATSHVISVRGDLPGAFSSTIWVSLANAEHSVFVPVPAVATELDADWSREDGKGLAGYDPELAGNAFRRLCALAETDRQLYGEGVRAFWRKREQELLDGYPSVLETAARAGDASVLTKYSMREQAKALKDAKRMFDGLVWQIAANNRIDGDVGGMRTYTPVPYWPKGLPRLDPNAQK